MFHSPVCVNRWLACIWATGKVLLYILFPIWSSSESPLLCGFGTNLLEIQDIFFPSFDTYATESLQKSCLRQLWVASFKLRWIVSAASTVYSTSKETSTDGDWGRVDIERRVYLGWPFWIYSGSWGWPIATSMRNTDIGMSWSNTKDREGERKQSLLLPHRWERIVLLLDNICPAFVMIAEEYINCLRMMWRSQWITSIFNEDSCFECTCLVLCSFV